MIDAALAKIFGTKTEREVKALRPTIAAIGELEPGLKQLSDIDLAAKTIEFRERLAQGASLEELLPEARKLAAQLVSKAPLALAQAKLAIHQGLNVDLESGLRLEAEAFAVTFSTEDRKEGMAAFLAKRPPAFRGK